jgi:hypothetical protein
MPIAKHKRDDHPYDRSQRADRCRSDQDAFPVLLEQTTLWLGLAALGFQDQFSVKPPPEIGVCCHWHQYSVELCGQVQQSLYLIVPANPPT